MRYIDPNQPDSKSSLKHSGLWWPMGSSCKRRILRQFRCDGKVFTKIPRSSVEDIELALDAAHKAKAGME